MAGDCEGLCDAETQPALYFCTDLDATEEIKSEQFKADVDPKRLREVLVRAGRLASPLASTGPR